MAWRDRKTNELSIGKVPLANPCEACCGGTGLYSTPEDCAKVLKALFDGGKPILQTSSIDEIMKPQVEDKKYFLEAATGVSRGQLAQTWPIGITDASFGLSSSIALEDFPNRRAKNSANWSGMPGVHAVSKPIKKCITTQILPICLLIEVVGSRERCGRTVDNTGPASRRSDGYRMFFGAGKSCLQKPSYIFAHL